MDKDGLTKAIFNFLDFAEKYDLKSDNFIIVGGGCGVLSNLWEETNDVDWLPLSDDVRNKVIELLDENEIERTFISREGYRLVADFKFGEAKYHLFCLEHINLALRPPFFESEKMDLNGREIYVRPLELLYKDYAQGFSSDKYADRARILKDYLNL